MKISSDVDLSEDVLKQPIAILGRTGSGKTYTAKGVVEKFLEGQRRVCIIDPTGVWWGLRSLFPVVIFGGKHGDVPVTEEAGAAMGRLVATSNIQCVLDLRDLLISQQRRFVGQFFEALYQHNTQPLHLVVDEADEFGPQNAQAESAWMLGQFDRIARRGRTRGFRLLSITQRPAKLHKDILGMAATVIAMQLTLPHDRKAMELWIKGQADPVKGKEVLDSLPKLRRGEGWIWSPDADILSRTRFPEIRSFDSSATPDDDVSTSHVTLAKVDLAAIRDQLAAANVEAEGSDPKRLREQVKELKAANAELRQQLNSELAKPLSIPPEEVANLRKLADKLINEVVPLRRFSDSVRSALEHIQHKYNELHREAHSQEGAIESSAPPTLPSVNGGTRPGDRDRVADEAGGRDGDRGRTPREVRGAGPSQAGSPAPSGPHEKILFALAWWRAVGVNAPTRVQVAFVAGYTASSGTFRNYLAEMRNAGLIDYAERSIIAKCKLPAVLQIPTRLELHERIRARLTGPQLKIFNMLVAHGGREMGRTQLAELTGYESSSGTFRNYLAEMKGLDLLRYPKKTTVQASGLLFPEGLA